MKIIHASIGYLSLRSLYNILKINCFVHFRLRKCLFTCLILSLCMMVWIINTFFRLADEICFYGYRKQVVTDPVFIISPPRSGTTFLQRTLAIDKENYFTPALYQVLFPSILLTRLVELLITFDRLLGQPFRHMYRLITKPGDGIWSHIHRTGPGLPEEDEGLWFLSFISPAWSMFVPQFESLKYLNILDHWPERETESIKKFYFNFLQRMQFIGGVHKKLIIKSVMSSGRINFIREICPNAKFICIDRDPYKTIPSYISMFSAPWKWFQGKAGISEYRSVGQSAIDFYNHLQEMLPKIPSENLLQVKFTHLTTHPEQVFDTIYAFTDSVLKDSFREQYEAIFQKRAAYQSAHQYDLADFGYSRSELENVLG